MYRKNLRTRGISAVIAVIAVVVGVAYSPLLGQTPAKAVTAQEFNPGQIITDANFYDGNSMGAEQVQSFLNQRVPNCLIGTKYTPGSLSPNGNVIASACLKDFRVTTQSKEANAYCRAYVGVANETAAQVIAKVGQACGISQKVLLVMLEKEQSLVTDDWPVTRMYNYAMGWGCPDSGPGNTANCDESGAGFAYQVYRSAWQFKVYKANPQDWHFKPNAWNQIQWHPNPGCGTSSVYIENFATAGLYLYTPYRPNQAALNAGWGTGDSCSSYGNRNFFMFYYNWFGGQPPRADQGIVGDVNDVSLSNGVLTVRGWAVDPDFGGAVDVHVYIGSRATVARADQPRTDVAAVYPAYGANRGYLLSIPVTDIGGVQNVCVFGIGVDTGGAKNGANVRLKNCVAIDFSTVQEKGRNPIGDVNSVTVQNGTLTVKGWAIDPDTVAPIDAHVYVGGRGYAVKANQYRADVGSAYSAYGPNHGFEFSLNVAGTTGNQEVCVYGINSVLGFNPKLGCKTTDFGVLQELGRAPIGDVNEVTVSNGTLTVRGWALDPDTVSPIDVHVYVGSRGYAVRADQARPDVAAVYKGYGESHGYTFSLDASGLSGNQQVCVYGINSVTGNNPRISCRTVNFGGIPELGRAPIGDVNEVTVSNGTLTVRGWALDPDTVSPIDVHVYVGSRGYAVRADQARPDVAAVYKDYGELHGFTFSMDVYSLAGDTKVCAYGINTVLGYNPQLGCRTLTF